MLQIDKSSFYLTILLKEGYLPLLSSSSIFVFLCLPVCLFMILNLIELENGSHVKCSFSYILFYDIIVSITFQKTDLVAGHFL